MKANHVFISYSRKDADTAKQVYRRLLDAGVSTWLDQQSIRPGSGYAEEIARAIAQAAAFVLLVSADANGSKEVHKEVQLAANEGVPIIPLRLVDVAYHPTLKYHLVGTQWVDAVGDLGGGIATLLDALGRLSLVRADIRENVATTVPIEPPDKKSTEQVDPLAPISRQDILLVLDRLQKTGKLLPLRELDSAYAMFRERFGPEVLVGWRGVQLLHGMFFSGDRASLVYWLDHGDPDNPRLNKARFGLIGGGAQHARFSLFRRAASEVWVAGRSKAVEREVSLSDAVEIAATFRDQLVAGALRLSELSAPATESDYVWLQEQLEAFAPDLCNRAWVHKYFHMLRPDLLDDFHLRPLQEKHLRRLGESIPSRNGRYVCAHPFVRVAQELHVPLNHLSAALNNL